MPHYPLFLSLTNRQVVIIGAGAVGKRKLQTLLLYAPEKIVLVDPLLADEAMAEPLRQTVAASAKEQSVCLVPAPFAPEHLDGALLVFVATDNPALNSQIATLCKERGILCNLADSEEQSDFIVPASIMHGPLAVALSTGGLSPALAKKLRQEIEILLGSGYSELAELMGRLRPKVLALGLPSEARANLFRSLVYSPLASLLEKGDMTGVSELLHALLPEQLHSCVHEVLQ